MKYRLVIIAFMIPIPIAIGIGIGCSDSHEVVLRLDDPALSQKGKYLLYNGDRFTGRVDGYFNGLLISESRYVNGLAEGLSQTWYVDGKIESSRMYRQGEKNGRHVGWWNNGNLRFEYYFSEGKYDGSFKEWYENGKPMHAFTYNLGREVSAVGWRENGRTYINFVVRNDKRYGLTNSRLCYSLTDEQGVYRSSNP